ncbi:MAG: RelA/SpoT family protein [Bacteroidales bacterium]|nr:RelA/SpoT family protein [Bacteroidales bacterium]
MYIINEDLEKREILKKYRSLLKVCRPSIKQEDKKMIRKAFNLAVTAHAGVRRKSGEPYVYHPIEVAHIAVSEIGLGGTSIVCALLHDVVEDTEYTIADIKLMFNDKVAQIVDGLTKLSDIFDKNSSVSIQAENFKKMLLTLSTDVRVILIKMADRLHNMRTLDALPHEKQLKVSYETTYLFAPLAHRLGLYNIKSEMEDLAFKYTEPEVYEEIQKKIALTAKIRESLISEFIDSIKPYLDAIGIEYQISSRLKTTKSIWDKMQKKQIPFEEVYDIFAIRIIINSAISDEKSDCYRVLAILYDHYIPNPERYRDWLAIPKANGYESLHTTLMYKQLDTHKGTWIEVQIRTVRMNEVAEKGFAAHWKYKSSPEKTNSYSGLDEWLLQIRNILHDQKEDTAKLLDDLHHNLEKDEIFVFTPKGDVKNLPYDASVLDFAYNIHSDIGNKCISAKVNNKLVPIYQKLKNADQVEIITSNKQKPREDWLNQVVTSKAKQAIAYALNEERRRLIEEGKEMLERKLKSLKLKADQKTIDKLAASHKLKNSQELFVAIYKQTISKTDIRAFAKKMNDALSIGRGIFKRKSDNDEVNRKKTSPISEAVLLFGSKMEPMDYSLGTCCNPIPGDRVFGFISVNPKGVRVHRTNCPNAKHMFSKYNYRIIKARWSNNKEGQFLSGLVITGFDKVGIVNQVTEVIRELNLNMHSISFETSQGSYEGTIMLYVNDSDQLKELMDVLKKIDGITSVKRIYSDISKVD